MNGTIKPPDFDAMMEITVSIRDLTLKKLLLELKIKEAESLIVTEVTTNPKYFKDGKVPAFNFIDATYKVSGLNGELLREREKLAVFSSELDYNKRRFEVLSGMLNAWQTESANMRASTL